MCQTSWYVLQKVASIIITSQGRCHSQVPGHLCLRTKDMEVWLSRWGEPRRRCGFGCCQMGWVPSLIPTAKHRRIPRRSLDTRPSIRWWCGHGENMVARSVRKKLCVQKTDTSHKCSGEIPPLLQEAGARCLTHTGKVLRRRILFSLSPPSFLSP